MILKIFYLIAIISIFATKDPNIILGCGIFGIINFRPSTLNKTAFNVLGINNDSRGGDSCGIFIDGKVEYGVGNKKLYSSFFKESELLNSTTKCSIALGHCRKASIGVISERTAQPVVLRDANGVAEFAVIHNGTIYNYKELAAKYIPNIDITGLTDSQVMTRIFYHCGYDVLNEYYGGAVFVIVDYREEKPKVLLWKGASKLTASTLNQTDERPLYFVYTKNSFIFSSIADYLDVFSDDEVYSPIANQLVCIKQDDIYQEAVYDREKVSQSSFYPEKPSSTSCIYENDIYFKHDNTSIGTVVISNTEGKIVLENTGLYTIKNLEAHGCFNIDAKGNIYNEAVPNKTIKVWFWDGVLLYGYHEFTFLKNMSDYYMLNPQDVKYCCGEILNYLSPYPINHPAYTPSEFSGLYCKANTPDSFEEYNGTIHRVLSNCRHSYIKGVSQGAIWNCTKEDAFTEFKNLVNTKRINVNNLYKDLYSA